MMKNNGLMKTGVGIVMFGVVLFGAGCAGPPEKVTIVHIGESDELGAPDHYTVVEFPDGERRKRSGHYGKEGDEFMARKHPTLDW